MSEYNLFNDDEKSEFERYLLKDISFQFMMNTIEQTPELKAMRDILINHGLNDATASHAVIEIANTLKNMEWKNGQ
jgi:ABC-type uncharacterized transport system permease subunit